MGTAQHNDGNVVFVKARKGVAEVFNLLGLDQIFIITESVKEAKRALRASPGTYRPM